MISHAITVIWFYFLSFLWLNEVLIKIEKNEMKVVQTHMNWETIKDNGVKWEVCETQMVTRSSQETSMEKCCPQRKCSERLKMMNWTQKLDLIELWESKETTAKTIVHKSWKRRKENTTKTITKVHKLSTQKVHKWVVNYPRWIWMYNNESQTSNTVTGIISFQEFTITNS